MDIVLLIDGSSSVSASDFELQRTVLQSFVSDLFGVSTDIRIAIAEFSRAFRLISSFSPTLSTVQAALASDLVQSGESVSNLGTALAGSTQVLDFDTRSRGAQPVTKLIVFITDGFTENTDPVSLTVAQQTLSRNNIISLGVGVTNFAGRASLANLVAPDGTVLNVNSYSDLNAGALLTSQAALCPTPVGRPGPCP